VGRITDNGEKGGGVSVVHDLAHIRSVAGQPHPETYGDCIRLQRRIYHLLDATFQFALANPEDVDVKPQEEGEK
jgi:hypothetical protein